MWDPSQVQLGFEVVQNASSASPVHHIITGSFRALSLALLAFSPLNRTLELVQQVSGLGPHQYLTTNANRNVVYATSWADPPSLSSWAVQSHPSWSVSLINSVPISEYQHHLPISPWADKKNIQPQRHLTFRFHHHTPISIP
jgi:carboxy-cis,cis-muconate cyclase